MPARCPARTIRSITVLAATVLAAALPSAARAQGSHDTPDHRATGERYHIEVSTTMWNPNLFGQISSDALNLVGSTIDFGKDLGFGTTRSTDVNVVVRPAKKHRFRIEYSPVTYTADTTFSRIITFAGVPFPVSLPIHSTFGWNTWRFGYEYDFIYRPRGFVGAMFEAQSTKLDASLSSAVIGGSTSGTAILPSIGIVGRAYVLRSVSVDFEVNGLCALHSKTGHFAMQCKQDLNPDYQASYFDWNVYGTINITNYVGAQVGWRRATTTLNLGSDRGQIAFQGIWFGGVARY